MNSNEFERLAKQLVSDAVEDERGISVPVETMEMVWFAHELGNKKCTIFSPMMPYYPEVTFDAARQKFYVDLYIKAVHKEYSYFELNKEK